jgi:hypothetical protein
MGASAVGEDMQLCPAVQERYFRREAILPRRIESVGHTLSVRDRPFFKRLSSAWAPKHGVSVRQVHLDISDDCDLACPLCYYPKSGRRAELSIEQITAIAKKHKGCAFILGGREPTARPDLPSVIRALKPFGSTMLLTHGLKLGDRNYLSSLIHAGLDGVILSFNGISNETYLKLNGIPCLARKRKAFASLREMRVPTAVSMTVSKGINEHEVGAILSLCQENADFVKEFRIRAARPLASAASFVNSSLTMPDLIELFKQHANFDCTRLFRGIEFWHRVGECFGVEVYRPRQCTVNFMLRRLNGAWTTEGDRLWNISISALDMWKSTPFLRPLWSCFLIAQMIRLFGLRPVLRRIRSLGTALRTFKPCSQRAQLDDVKGRSDLLQITLKSWPKPGIFPESEKRKCHTLLASPSICGLFCDKLEILGRLDKMPASRTGVSDK